MTLSIRKHGMLLGFLSLLQCAAEVSGKAPCLLSGTVADDKNQAVPGALLVLIKPNARQDALIDGLELGAPLPLGRPEQTTTTDSSGAFCFDSIAAGEYVLQARKEGYLPANYGSRSPLQLPEVFHISGSDSKVVFLRLVPGGTVSGRVADAAGRPLKSGVVRLLTEVWYRGERRWVAVKGAPVSADGGYRISDLPPGRYFARFDPDAASGLPDGSSTAPARPTYYPRSETLSMARPISVSAGEVLSNINIVAAPGGGSSLFGRLLLNGRPPSLASLQLLKKREEPTAWILGASMLDEKGGFRYSNVAPGDYRLFYLVREGGGTSAGAVDLTLEDGAVSEIRLEIPEPVSVKGRALIEHATGTTSGHVTIFLMPATGILNPGCTSRPTSDGFLLEGCSPGLYHVRVTSLPESHYVREVLYGESPVRERPFRLDRETRELKVLLRSRAARVAGQLATRNSGWYLIMGEGEANPMALGCADRDGSFSVDHLRPGRYHLVGMVAPNPSTFHHPESLRALLARGTQVSAAEGERVEITVPVVFSEAPDAAIWH